MANQIPSVKGMRVLDEELSAVFQAVEARAQQVFSSYGYREIRTPLAERTELFVRSVGESTDIVGKEMYTFEDRGGRSLTLRPEGTAPVVRAVVERGLRGTPLPLKLFYLGPYFRYERPQKGRYRQFFQIGAELIGDPRPEADVEVIQMLVEFLAGCGFSGLEVALQTLGDDQSRADYGAALVDYLEPYRAQLSEDSQARLDTNPLRILDSKSPVDREIVADAPRMESYLSPEARSHFERVRELLEVLNIAYRVEPSLVRGLDYYTGLVFEIASSALGAQDALVGGGRYDNLVAELGGPATPAIGFAIGLDRVCEAMPKSQDDQASLRVVVLPLDEEAVTPGLEAAATLRAAGLQADLGTADRGIGKALRAADRRGAGWVVLVGEEEIAAGSWTAKNLTSGEQQTVASLEQLVSIMTNKETEE